MIANIGIKPLTETGLGDLKKKMGLRDLRLRKKKKEKKLKET